MSQVGYLDVIHGEISQEITSFEILQTMKC